jgi:hypothetical protein
MLAAAVAAAPAVAPAQEDEERAIRFAWKELRSALRHEEGAKACRRMTLKYRKQLLGAVKDAGGGGLGCERVIDVAGREAYRAIRHLAPTLRQISVHGTKARACSPGVATMSFRKQGGIWKFNGDSKTPC